MTTTTSSCLVCTDSFETRLLPCNCTVCSSCVLEWVSTEIKDHSLNGESYVRCPNSVCLQKCQIDTLLTKIPIQDHAQLCDPLFKNYVQQAPDVINCQRGTCHYYGIMPEKCCSDDLICELCGHKWKDKSQFGLLEAIYKGLFNMQEILNQLQTFLYRCFFTLQCPRCKIGIKKAGGCDHMTCKKCGHEFCWVCKQDYHSHSSVTCGAHTTIKYILGLALLLNMGILMGIHLILWNVITGATRFFFKLCFFNLTFLIIFLMFFPIVCFWKERRCIYWNKKRLAGYCVWFFGMIYVTSWQMKAFVIPNAEEIIWTFFTELMIGGIISGSYYVTETWLKIVL